MENKIKAILRERRIKSYQIAKELGITPNAVTQHLNEHFHRVSKRNRRAIRNWLIDHGIIVVKLRPKHECPDCGKVHVIARPKASQ